MSCPRVRPNSSHLKRKGNREAGEVWARGGPSGGAYVFLYEALMLTRCQASRIGRFAKRGASSGAIRLPMVQLNANALLCFENQATC